MTRMGIRLSSGSRCPQSPKASIRICIFEGNFVAIPEENHVSNVAEIAIEAPLTSNPLDVIPDEMPFDVSHGASDITRASPRGYSSRCGSKSASGHFRSCSRGCIRRDLADRYFAEDKPNPMNDVCERYAAHLKSGRPHRRHLQVQNRPASRQNGDREHDGHLHQFSRPSAQTRDDPQRADSTKPAPNTSAK